MRLFCSLKAHSSIFYCSCLSRRCHPRHSPLVFRENSDDDDDETLEAKWETIYISAHFFFRFRQGINKLFSLKPTSVCLSLIADSPSRVCRSDSSKPNFFDSISTRNTEISAYIGVSPLFWLISCRFEQGIG